MEGGAVRAKTEGRQSRREPTASEYVQERLSGQIRPPYLIPSSVVRLLADTKLAGHGGEVRAVGEHPLGLPELADDLLRGVTLPAVRHDLTGPCPRTLGDRTTLTTPGPRNWGRASSPASRRSPERPSHQRIEVRRWRRTLMRRALPGPRVTSAGSEILAGAPIFWKKSVGLKSPSSAYYAPAAIDLTPMGTPARLRDMAEGRAKGRIHAMARRPPPCNEQACHLAARGSAVRRLRSRPHSPPVGCLNALSSTWKPRWIDLSAAGYVAEPLTPRRAPPRASRSACLITTRRAAAYPSNGRGRGSGGWW